MRKNQYYQYFVEGEDEKKIVNILKSELKLIVPGKVQIFNVVEERLTKLRLRTLKRGTKVVLIFDTDTGKLNTLEKNLEFLQRESNISDTICITQVKNLEDELIRSCGIRQIKELTESRSNKDFKRDLIKDSNFCAKLEKKEFDFKRFWCTEDNGIYKGIKNMAYKIKL